MPWGVVYYRAADGRVPADEFLDGCPDKVEATILAVLEAVRRAPPPACSGGGINGMDKPVGQLFSDAEYRRHVRRLGNDYLRTLPRPIATDNGVV